MKYRHEKIYCSWFRQYTPVTMALVLRTIPCLLLLKFMSLRACDMSNYFPGVTAWTEGREGGKWGAILNRNLTSHSTGGINKRWERSRRKKWISCWSRTIYLKVGVYASFDLMLTRLTEHRSNGKSSIWLQHNAMSTFCHMQVCNLLPCSRSRLAERIT